MLCFRWFVCDNGDYRGLRGVVNILNNINVIGVLYRVFLMVIRGYDLDKVGGIWFRILCSRFIFGNIFYRDGIRSFEWSIWFIWLIIIRKNMVSIYVVEIVLGFCVMWGYENEEIVNVDGFSFVRRKNVLERGGLMVI